MLEIQNKNIRFTRGDSIRFVIRLTGRELPEGTKAVFTVKDTPWEPCEPVIEKILDVADSKVSVVLDPEDTQLPAGHYVWDLRLREPAEDGRTEVLTPMEYGAIQVLEAIGE